MSVESILTIFCPTINFNTSNSLKTVRSVRKTLQNQQKILEIITNIKLQKRHNQ